RWLKFDGLVSSSSANCRCDKFFASNRAITTLLNASLLFDSIFMFVKLSWNNYLGINNMCLKMTKTANCIHGNSQKVNAVMHEIKFDE
ncbi:MAG: hypothetical protein RL040_1036, partial [Bacteroidota bacterium]